MNDRRGRCAAVLTLVATLGVGACVGASDDEAPALDGGPLSEYLEWPSEHPAFPPTSTSTVGMVVTGSSYATGAGVWALEQGGNAVDAAVTAAFALTVAEPTQSGLGGRTQMLIRLADGTVHGIDGTTQVPAAYDPVTAPRGEHGHAAIGIPGTLAALARALEEHGTMSLGEALVPALAAAARSGVLMSPAEVERIASFADELDPQSAIAHKLLDERGRSPAARRLFYQPELAGTLRRLVSGGANAFYRGEIADSIAADMARNGGFVTKEDLAAYQAVDAEIGRGSFRGFELIGSYLPASGVTVIEILQILDRMELPAEEGPWAATVAEALLAGFEDREIAEAFDPPAAVAWLTSDSLADRRAAEIEARLQAGAGLGAAGSDAAVDLGLEPVFTTHLSVADRDGNVVALTQSLGPSGGARVVTPGLGFLYASTLGGYLSGGGPGYRPWSSQAPFLVIDQGTPVLVMGGAGSRRILSAMVATLVRVLDRRVSLEEGMSAPRLHPTGDVVYVEEGWSAAAALARMGYRIEEREAGYFARLNAIHRTGSVSVGVGEPRWIESAAAGPRPRN